MVEQTTLETYSYQGTKHPDATEWGFRIERQNDIEHHVPVTEAFPDRWGDYARFREAIESSFKRKFWKDQAERDKEINTFKQLFPQYASPDVDPQTFVSNLSEAYELTSWGKSARLYNFDEKLLTEAQLNQITNAVRAVAQLTGGSLFDHLTEIVILPEGHPTLLDTGNFSDYTSADKIPQVLASTSRGGNVVMINAKFLPNSPQEIEKPAEIPNLEIQPVRFGAAERVRQGVSATLLRRETASQKKRRHELKKRAIDKYRERVKALPQLVGNKYFEGILAHELHHILGAAYVAALNKFEYSGNPSEDDELPKELPPSQYSTRVPFKVNQRIEEFAETGEALFLGDEWDKLVGPIHRASYQETIQRMHSQQEGPTFVINRELNPRNIKKQENI